MEQTQDSEVRMRVVPLYNYCQYHDSGTDFDHLGHHIPEMVEEMSYLVVWGTWSQDSENTNMTKKQKNVLR